MLTRKDVGQQIYIVSYPRSGNTWMRFLLMNMFYPEEEISFPNVNRLVPDAHQKAGWHKHKVFDPLILKCHIQEYAPYYVSKNVYIYRDGRDVAVSYYYFKGLDKELEFNEYLFRFIDGGLHMWKPWINHVYFWLLENPKFDFIPICYEELIKNPEENLKKIMWFLNIKKIDSSDEAIERAVKNCCHENLSNIAQRDGLKPSLLGKKARTGYWKDYINKEMLNYWWRRIGDVMERIGYEKGESNK